MCGWISRGMIAAIKQREECSVFKCCSLLSPSHFRIWHRDISAIPRLEQSWQMKNRRWTKDSHDSFCSFHAHVFNTLDHLYMFYITFASILHYHSKIWDHLVLVFQLYIRASHTFSVLVKTSWCCSLKGVVHSIVIDVFTMKRKIDHSFWPFCKQPHNFWCSRHKTNLQKDTFFAYLISAVLA